MKWDHKKRRFCGNFQSNRQHRNKLITIQPTCCCWLSCPAPRSVQHCRSCLRRGNSGSANCSKKENYYCWSWYHSYFFPYTSESSVDKTCSTSSCFSSSRVSIDTKFNLDKNLFLSKLSQPDIPLDPPKPPTHPSPKSQANNLPRSTTSFDGALALILPCSSSRVGGMGGGMGGGDGGGDGGGGGGGLWKSPE